MWISKEKYLKINDRLEALEFAAKNPPKKNVGDKHSDGLQKFIITKVELKPSVTEYIFGIPFTHSDPHWLYTCIDLANGLEYQLKEIQKITKKKS